MNIRTKLIALFIAPVLVASPMCATAATYYVDMAAGSDANNGTSTATPWRHSPGDANATGVAATNVLRAGCTVNFKRGVVYYGRIELARSGTSTSNITLQAASNWGSGSAVIDGGGVGWTITPGGDYQVYSGLTVTNFHYGAFALLMQTGIIITNCYINNGVTSRSNPEYGNNGAGIDVGGMINCVIVSNEITATGQKGILGYGGAVRGNTNIIIWGNYIHDTQDDPINMGCEGYFVIAYNRFWHCTNTDGSIGAHTDASQIMQIPYGSMMVYAFNSISNINGGGLFIEANAADNNDFVTSDVTNVLNLVNGQLYQICTNQTTPHASSSTRFSYNGTLYKVGDVFTGTSTTNGFFTSTNVAFLIIKRVNGDVWFVGNTVESVAYCGVDNYDSMSSFHCWNNTFTNIGGGGVSGSDARNYQCWMTNQEFYNNIELHCNRSAPFWVTPESVNINAQCNEHSGFNLFDSSANFGTNGNHAAAGGTTLAQFQAFYPGLERNTIIGSVTFVGGGNYQIVSSPGTGAGTNLTALVPDLSCIPAQWRPDLTKDAAGNQRPNSGAWDIGAFQGTHAFGVNWYVDAAATGSHNGTSWATAWTNLLQVSGVSAGDTIYISGGGSSQTYHQTEWDPTYSGSSGNPITFTVGTDSSHNGRVIFDGDGTNYFFWGAHANFPANWITIDGTTNQLVTIQGYNTAFYADNCDNLTVQGVRFINGAFRDLSGNNVTLAYDYFNVTNASNAAQTSTNSVIHNCLFILSRDTGGGDGDVGVQWPGYGSIIYSNVFLGNVISNYTTGKHQDGIQAWDSNLKIFNNSFYNLGESATFIAPAASVYPITNVWVYNNVAEYCYQNFAFGNNNSHTEVTTYNIIFANNTVSDCVGFDFGNVSGTGTNHFVNSIVANNIVWNSGSGIIIAPDIGITNGNVLVANPTGLNYFSAYTTATNRTSFSTNQYYFHLTAAATPMIGTGTNLSSYFTTDHDNNTRSATGAWDIGAYEYAISNPPPVTPPIILTGAAKLPNGAFQFAFTNTPDVTNTITTNITTTIITNWVKSTITGYTTNITTTLTTNTSEDTVTVLTTTNLLLPLTNWTVLGTVTDGPPGRFQFSDPQATNRPMRFYRVRSS